MELTDELLARMGAYVSGQMNETERQAFETHLQQNPDLEREVRIQYELKRGLSLIDQKQRFKAMHTDLLKRGLLPTSVPEQAPDSPTGESGRVVPLSTSRPTYWPNWNYLTVAASLVLLVGIGWSIVWRQSMPTAQAIQRDKAFDSVFTPDLKAEPQPPTDPDRLGASPPVKSDTPDSLRLQRGVDLLQNQQFQPAILDLKSITQSAPGHWQASAQWFLALACLKTGQTSQTDSLLAIIIESNGHPYQLEARRLRSQLPYSSTNRP